MLKATEAGGCACHPHKTVGNTRRHEAGTAEETQMEAGEYKAQIVSASCKQHRNGYDVLEIWIDLDTPEGAGEMLPKRYNLTSKASRRFMQDELGKLGVEVGSRKEMEKAPGLLEGLRVDVRLGYNEKDYPVLFFLGLPVEEGDGFDPDSVWEEED